MNTSDNQRTLTELEFVEAAVRRAANLVGDAHASSFMVLANELMVADISQLDGGSDTRLWELLRLRSRQL